MKTKNDYSLAATILAIGIAVSLMLWAANVRAEDAPAEHWKIVFGVVDHGEPLVLTYGSNETGPVYFPSKDACNEAMEKDEKVAKATAALKEVVAQRQAEFVGGACMKDDVPIRPKDTSI